MTEDTMPAATPADTATTMPAAAPAEHHQEHYEQPAETPEHDYEEQFTEEHEEPADLGEILEDRPKKLSGAQRAKLQRQYLENEIAARDQRIAEFERFINERDQNDRQTESERHAEAQRKRAEAHRERIKGVSEIIPDFSRVMRSMEGKKIHEDLLEDVLSSDKSELLAYHLASNPQTLDRLNHLPERERVREIGRLEATLKKPEGKKQTSAPPPPTTLKGGAAPSANPNTGPSDMNSFATWLKKDLAARRRR